METQTDQEKDKKKEEPDIIWNQSPRSTIPVPLGRNKIIIMGKKERDAQNAEGEAHTQPQTDTEASYKPVPKTYEPIYSIWQFINLLVVTLPSNLFLSSHVLLYNALYMSPITNNYNSSINFHFLRIISIALHPKKRNCSLTKQRNLWRNPSVPLISTPSHPPLSRTLLSLSLHRCIKIMTTW